MTMNVEAIGTPNVEAERKQRVEEMGADQEPEWMERFGPGSFGCHELLDRTSLMVNNLEQYILAHPSCLRDPEWYSLADRALTALMDLYQKIGAAHLDVESDAPARRG